MRNSLLLIVFALFCQNVSAQLKINLGTDTAKIETIEINTNERVIRKKIPFADKKVEESIARAKKDNVYDVVEKSAEFPGGDEAMRSFIMSNMQYPLLAKESGIEGIVKVKFIVSEKGALSDFEITKSIKGGCDEEALRVCKKMPSWKPALIKGMPVKSTYVLPFMFSLGR